MTWPYAFDWMRAGGNILDPMQFFGDAIRAGGTASFLSIDMAIAWLVYMVWVLFDTKRIGMGARWGVFFVVLSYIGVSMAFPFYLIARERFIDKNSNGDEVLATARWSESHASAALRHGFFIVLGVATLFLTWPYAFDWMAKGGNILNPVQFFGDAIAAGGTAAFLSIDMAIAWAVFMLWVLADVRRIGLGISWGWFFVILSYIGVSMAYPLYLVVRERWVDRVAEHGQLKSIRPMSAPH